MNLALFLSAAPSLSTAVSVGSGAEAPDTHGPTVGGPRNSLPLLAHRHTTTAQTANRKATRCPGLALAGHDGAKIFIGHSDAQARSELGRHYTTTPYYRQASDAKSFIYRWLI